MKQISYTSSHSTGLVQKAVAVVASVALAAVALMFSALLLAFILIVALFGVAYLWWKIRGLRKQMKNFPRHGAVQGDAFKGDVFEGEVIEGEAIRVDTKRNTP